MARQPKMGWDQYDNQGKHLGHGLLALGSFQNADDFFGHSSATTPAAAAAAINNKKNHNNRIATKLDDFFLSPGQSQPPLNSSIVRDEGPRKEFSFSLRHCSTIQMLVSLLVTFFCLSWRKLEVGDSKGATHFSRFSFHSLGRDCSPYSDLVTQQLMDGKGVAKKELEGLQGKLSTTTTQLANKTNDFNSLHLESLD
ncbi:hypothetical protein SELMODRAFT_419900 [Selaginella moellendorffii]|uniref:Uncharacterized protein n=1 Tax=Selaginella moellendorffii TaxID=88036 RepID=D8SAW6_SELML|nr:hypothetical protein SELMODRAFT_419900 [Selaginella moellendorffii]